MAPSEDYGETKKKAKKSPFSPNKLIILPNIASQIEVAETNLKYEISPKA